MSLYVHQTSQTGGFSYANNDDSTENVIFHRIQNSYGNNEIYSLEDGKEEEDEVEADEEAGNANTPLIFNNEGNSHK